MSLSSALKTPFPSTACRLIGPPEARGVLGLNVPGLNVSKSAGSTFVDLMDSQFNASSSSSAPPPNMGRTENNSPTFTTSGNPCVDFFSQVVPSTRRSTVVSLLSSAWAHDPLTALKLVCNLRGVRGTGKSDKKGFYASALWLHSHHPKTLAANVDSFAKFGYMKDLLFILQQLIHGPSRPKPKRHIPVSSPEEASALREKRRTDHALKVLDRYASDPVYQFLHDRVADFFAKELLSDLENLTAGRLNKVKLSAKWCPSLYSSFDERTLICESIARRIFPRESFPAYRDMEEEHYAYRIRDRLRKDVLVPLRRVIELPEVYIGAGNWGLIPYNRVASVAMRMYTDLFLRRDGKRFSEYLKEVKKGRAKITAGSLLPHEIAGPICGDRYNLSGEEAAAQDEVAELQWSRIVGDMLVIGKLSNCIAVCDVSRSMCIPCGTPMNVCIAMGLLLSELSEEPWKGRVITFSAEPHLHKVKGESLRDKMFSIRMMEWGMNTDFQKVFDQMLEVAVRGKLSPEQMIKRVFVFSDMEFDEASANDWETDYEAICRKFEVKGYGSCVPEIVFWNLRDSRSIPVTSQQKGVALVSGFSKNMMKLFLKGGDQEIVSPESIMEQAISDWAYSKLVVVD